MFGVHVVFVWGGEHAVCVVCVGRECASRVVCACVCKPSVCGVCVCVCASRVCGVLCVCVCVCVCVEGVCTLCVHAV